MFVVFHFVPIISALAASKPEVPLWRGKSAGFEVSLFKNNMAVTDGQGKEIFSFSNRKNPTAERTSRVKPVALVGTYLTLEIDSVEQLEGAAHANVWTRFQTIDLRNPQLKRGVKLTQFFSESEIVEALLQDSFVKKELKQPFKGIRSLKNLINQWPATEVCLGLNQAEESFAFHSILADKIAIRIGSNTSIGCSGTFNQVVAVMPIPKDLLSSLTDANEERSGFLMKDTKSLFGSVQYTANSL